MIKVSVSSLWFDDFKALLRLLKFLLFNFSDLKGADKIIDQLFDYVNSRINIIDNK